MAQTGAEKDKVEADDVNRKPWALQAIWGMGGGGHK